MPFDHEKLRVYQAALSFVEWLHPVLNSIPKSVAVHNQLDRASTSIALNIAEGNGKRTSADRVKFFDTSCGSALECAAGLDVACCKQLISLEDASAGKLILEPLVGQLVGLMKSHGTNYRDEVTGHRLREVDEWSGMNPEDKKGGREDEGE